AESSSSSWRGVPVREYLGKDSRGPEARQTNACLGQCACARFPLPQDCRGSFRACLGRRALRQASPEVDSRSPEPSCPSQAQPWPTKSAEHTWHRVPHDAQFPRRGNRYAPLPTPATRSAADILLRLGIGDRQDCETPL